MVAPRSETQQTRHAPKLPTRACVYISTQQFILLHSDRYETNQPTNRSISFKQDETRNGQDPSPSLTVSLTFRSLASHTNLIHCTKTKEKETNSTMADQAPNQDEQQPVEDQPAAAQQQPQPPACLNLMDLLNQGVVVNDEDEDDDDDNQPPAQVQNVPSPRTFVPPSFNSKPVSTFANSTTTGA